LFSYELTWNCNHVSLWCLRKTTGGLSRKQRRELMQSLQKRTTDHVGLKAVSDYQLMPKSVSVERSYVWLASNVSNRKESWEQEWRVLMRKTPMMNTTSFSTHEQLLDIPSVSTSPDLTRQPDLVFTSSPLLFISSGGSLVQPRPREDIRGVFVSCTCMMGGGILA
jgi:hypothetical protein